MPKQSRIPPLLKKLPSNNILGNKGEYEKAIKIARKIGLPIHKDKPKNWDSLAAVSFFLNYCDNRYGKILDAGGEYYSAFLLQLASLGYTDLTCINLSFKRPLTVGPISFEYGNLTKTGFKENYFDGISCLSVIEHGVEINDYFKEMSRVLKIGGILFTSTDYWDTPVDVGNRFSYDHPVRIFSSVDILNMIHVAKKFGFELIGPLHLSCKEKVVECLDLKYTFIYFVLQKVDRLTP